MTIVDAISYITGVATGLLLAAWPVVQSARELAHERDRRVQAEIDRDHAARQAALARQAADQMRADAAAARSATATLKHGVER